MTDSSVAAVLFFFLGLTRMWRFVVALFSHVTSDGFINDNLSLTKTSLLTWMHTDNDNEKSKLAKNCNLLTITIAIGSSVKVLVQTGRCDWSRVVTTMGYSELEQYSVEIGHCEQFCDTGVAFWQEDTHHQNSFAILPGRLSVKRPHTDEVYVTARSHCCQSWGWVVDCLSQRFAVSSQPTRFACRVAYGSGFVETCKTYWSRMCVDKLRMMWVSNSPESWFCIHVVHDAFNSDKEQRRARTQPCEGVSE